MALAALAAVALVSLFSSLRNFYLNRTVPAPAVGGTYREGFVGQPNYLNPLLAYQEPDTALVRLIYSGLYRHDGNGQVTPDLAEAMPTVSEDQKQYTVRLRKDIRWHNDRPVTADDVVYTVTALQDPAYKSPLRALWLSTSVEKVDDRTVKFTTKDISGPFLQNLTLPILPENAWSRVPTQSFAISPLNLQAIGSGPYAVREIKKFPSGKVQSLKLESFSNYYGGKPKVEVFVAQFFDTEAEAVNALHGKEIDGFGHVEWNGELAVSSERGAVNRYLLPLPQYQVAFFNLQRAPWGDLPVRRALDLATDRTALVSEVLKNGSQLPAFHVATGSTSNLTEAQRLLTGAGWNVDASSGVRHRGTAQLKLKISTNDFPQNVQVAEALAAQWRRLQVSVEVEVMPTKQLSDERIRPRSFDVLVFQQRLGADPDPFAFWHSSQVRDPGLNLSSYRDQTADKLIAEARATTDQAVRAERYRQFYELIERDVPALYLSQSVYTYAVSRNIRGVTLTHLPDQSLRLLDVPNWYVREERVWK